MDKQWVGGEFNPTHGPATGTVEPAPAKWPNDVERQGNFFWTRTTPRPTRETWEFVSPTLEEAQAIWDGAQAKVEAHDARMAEMREERDGAECERRAKAEAAFLARQDEAAAARAEELKSAHVAAGGTDATWQAEREEILRADRQQRTLESSPARSLISREAMLA